MIQTLKVVIMGEINMEKLMAFSEQSAAIMKDSINAGLDFAGDGLEAYYKLLKTAFTMDRNTMRLSSIKGHLVPHTVRSLYNLMTYAPAQRKLGGNATMPFNVLTVDINVHDEAEKASDRIMKNVRDMFDNTATSTLNRATRNITKRGDEKERRTRRWHKKLNKWLNNGAEGEAPANPFTDGEPVTAERGMTFKDLLERFVHTAAARFARSLLRLVAFDAQERIAAKLGFTTKRWVTVSDTRVRDSHRILHGRTARINGSFQTVGGRLRYPHDPRAPLSETINCRCSLEWL